MDASTEFVENVIPKVLLQWGLWKLLTLKLALQTSIRKFGSLSLDLASVSTSLVARNKLYKASVVYRMCFNPWEANGQSENERIETEGKGGCSFLFGCTPLTGCDGGGGGLFRKKYCCYWNARL